MSFTASFHQKNIDPDAWIIAGIWYVILAPFLSEAVEASRCYFYENWLMKLKCSLLMNHQGCILLTYVSVISFKFIQKFAQKCQYFTLIDQSVPLYNFYITFYLRTNQLWINRPNCPKLQVSYIYLCIFNLRVEPFCTLELPPVLQKILRAQNMHCFAPHQAVSRIFCTYYVNFITYTYSSAIY